MIYVSKQQLNQVEYLIDQSIRGNHVLFDVETLRRVFSDSATPLIDDSEAEADASSPIERHIEKLILQPSLLQKRAYLERLDEGTFVQVVRTYFNIVENNLFEATDTQPAGRH